ncbi:MAG: CHASE2 domain-containing protein, partial [Bacteroidetes bacterium]|nr:CHASE2 domain-containing protein [Bacteroidota bacterium]
MAGQAISRHGRASLLLTAVSALLLVILYTPLTSLDDSLHVMHYRIRGTQPADSTIVLVYIDDESLRSLGWPVKRNFHALMLNVLSELGARAIGVEVVFEDERVEYAEYDDLLETVARAAGNIVLPCYFDALEDSRAAARDSRSVPAGPDERFIGVGAHFPFPRLRGAVAAVGHVHYTDDGDVPLVIQSDRGRVPAFGLALLQVFSGGNVRYAGEALVIDDAKNQHEINTPGGVVALNHPGGIDAYRKYPFIEVLRAYDAMRLGRGSRVPLSSFKDKIVLVCVVAEGRSRFVDTAVDSRLPSVALHAAFIDNALRDRFLTRLQDWLVFALSILFAGASALAVVALRRPYGVLIPLGGIAMILALSVFLFVRASVVLPVAPFLLVGV